MRNATPFFIENTIPSVAEAFRRGATMVEIDLHYTADGHIIVFHDAGLECRTNGKGTPEQNTLAYIKQLDAGYGYTGDGKAYPFRGHGVGLIPTLKEMLDAFPNRSFLLDNKVKDSTFIRLLGELLATYPHEQRRQLILWGPADTYDKVQRISGSLGGRMRTRKDMVECARSLLRRLAFGPLPRACQGAALIFPGSRLDRWYVKLAGWPHRFLRKARAANVPVYVTTDDPNEAREYRLLPLAGIMTDRIDLIGAVQ